MAGIDIVSLSRNVVPYVIEQRRYFHCHPEPTSREFKTMKYIQNELDQMKIPYTNIPDEEFWQRLPEVDLGRISIHMYF